MQIQSGKLKTLLSISRQSSIMAIFFFSTKMAMEIEAMLAFATIQTAHAFLKATKLSKTSQKQPL